MHVHEQSHQGFLPVSRPLVPTVAAVLSLILQPAGDPLISEHLLTIEHFSGETDL